MATGLLLAMSSAILIALENVSSLSAYTWLEAEHDTFRRGGGGGGGAIPD